jgi:hypothetical protein
LVSGKSRVQAIKHGAWGLSNPQSEIERHPKPDTIYLTVLLFVSYYGMKHSADITPGAGRSIAPVIGHKWRVYEINPKKR